MYISAPAVTIIRALISVIFVVSAAFAASLDDIRRSRLVCDYRNHLFLKQPPATCPTSVLNLRNTIYLLYDVNPPEGFNLRRDVYIRLAVFVRNLQRQKTFANVRLVLPPFRRLYHWKTQRLTQENLSWSEFFDVESLKRFAPILEFSEFLEEIRNFGFDSQHNVQVQQTFQLKQFEDMFENGVFRDKFEFEDCHRQEYIRGYLLHQPQLSMGEFTCLKFQGSANLLEKVLRKTLAKLPTDDFKVFAFLNAEIVLHDSWGDREFWMARRSMRFASHLIAIANSFRLQHFNSSNDFDKVQRPSDWKQEKPYRKAHGGAYLCAHLRRGDFIYGREKTTPTLRSAAMQIKNKMQEMNLEKLYVATDANQFELKNFKSYLQRVKKLSLSLEQKSGIGDGGVAIVDQLICAHAHYFIGTYESTFTYRIYEEREILGFPQNLTFNTLCKSEDLVECSKNAVWPIVY